MEIFRSIKVLLVVILSILGLFTIILGAGFGYLLALTHNLDMRGNLHQSELALPSRALDRNGELIAEYFGDEKRILVSLDDIPEHLVEAILAREDEAFFTHKGIDLLGSLKAAFNYFTGIDGPGASTITQQVIRLMKYEDINDYSLSRKIREMWYALQLERQFTKQEILEYYINNSFFGSGAHGIEAASQYYFKHSSKKITLGESALLVILMSNPGRYNPYKYPDAAKFVQNSTLDRMIEAGFITREDADLAFIQFWDNFDYTRPAKGSLYEENKSLFPHFAEYVRLEILKNLYGNHDINRDGFTIYTTLDLKAQRQAERIMDAAYVDLNVLWNKQSQRRTTAAGSYLPLIDLLSLTSDITGLSVKGAQNRSQARDFFDTEYIKELELVSLLVPDFGNIDIIQQKRTILDQYLERNTIEGALICIETHTGQIIAMIGGSDFETSEVNRATGSRLMPGSSFKPLYYSAAIKHKVITQGTMLEDSPVTYAETNSIPFEPKNYVGSWRGTVLAWEGIAYSLNVPSVKVMDMVGFDRAFDTASKLLGLYEYKDNEEYFYHGLSSALGISPVAPVNMVQAYATIGNNGREVIPYAIKMVKNREGTTILDFEKQLRQLQEAKRASEVQILSPQEAFIVRNMLQNVTWYGTLNNSLRRAGFDRENINISGKTGTTENWGDAWTLGFTDYYTTAVWFGFDRPGNSLGREITGATGAGPRWAEFMTVIHKDKESRQFEKPGTGIISRTVCAKSGDLYNERVCTDGKKELFYLSGTEPKTLCTYHNLLKDIDDFLINQLENIDDYIDTDNVPDDLQTLDHWGIELGIEDSDSSFDTGGISNDNPWLDDADDSGIGNIPSNLLN